MIEKVEWEKPPDGVPSSHRRSVPLWFKAFVVLVLLCAAFTVVGSVIVALLFPEEIP